MNKVREQLAVVSRDSWATVVLLFILSKNITKTDLKFTDEEDEKLIELVGKNPPLFNPELEAYRDANVRDNIWKGIAKFLNKTDADCKKRWKYIRDSYNRFKRKMKTLNTTGSAAPPKKSKLQFFERLNFLEHTQSERDSSSNVESSEISVTPGTSDATEQSVLQDQEPVSQNQQVDETKERSKLNPNVTVPSIKKRRKKTQDEFINYLQKRDESRQLLLEGLGNVGIQSTTGIQSNTIESEDDISSFANNVKCVLRKLNPRLKVLAKSEVFNILTKYEMMEMETPRSLTAMSSSTDTPYSATECSPTTIASPPSYASQPTDLTTHTQQEQNERHLYDFSDIITYENLP